MQKIVDELRNIIEFKNTTDIGDTVLIVAKKPQMLMYAFVNEIEKDMSRKDEWWNIHLTMLSVPLQHIVWTLRTEQMTGKEIFTMGGNERFMQAINFNTPPRNINPVEKKKKQVKNGLKRIK